MFSFGKKWPTLKSDFLPLWTAIPLQKRNGVHSYVRSNFEKGRLQIFFLALLLQLRNNLSFLTDFLQVWKVAKNFGQPTTLGT